jgi:fumarate reductase subunit D
MAVRLLFPILAVGTAVYAEQKGWGLFVLTPVFWRMHRMHHADLDFDVTTALRFHPLEIVLSTGIKLVAVLIFEV